MAERKLTGKQKLFVKEYLIDLNATQAALRAGYSNSTAYSIGQENLKKPEIKNAIQKAMDKRSERTEITADYVLNGIKETVERCMQAKPIIDATGKPVMVELANGDFAPAYKFDANSALKGYELLGKHLKLFTDKHEVTGANGGAIKVDNRLDLSELSDKELELYEELAILRSERDQTGESET